MASVVALVVEVASLASALGFASSEYTVAVSDLPFIGEYAAVAVDDVDAVAGVKERGGEGFYLVQVSPVSGDAESQ